MTARVGRNWYSIGPDGRFRGPSRAELLDELLRRYPQLAHRARMNRQDRTGGAAMATSPEPGILTWSGRFVPLYGGADAECPAIVDIAVALSRQPRFGGNCRRWWSVLDHTLFVERLALRQAEEAGFPYYAEFTRRLRLAALLHDAHEAVTGDIPSPFKTEDMQALQERLDRRIFARYFPGGILRYVEFAQSVHALDHRALLAEAHVVGPSRFQNQRTVGAPVAAYFGAEPHSADVSALECWIEQYGLGAMPQCCPEPLTPTVQQFLLRVAELS